jgi:tetratricopeptide (TPR) repeat protein
LTQPQAISGLGGIGKTQTAVEFAYRYQDDYEFIQWVKAESTESMISDFATMAYLLDLPEQQEQEQSRVVDAVKRWFQEHTGWLLIFDNADDLTILWDFLPTGGKGHILLTTREQATGRIARRIEIEKMEPEEGAYFLLRRAALLDPDAPLDAASPRDLKAAREIVQAMIGLPLAIDQAGAFIDETRCSLSDYLHFFQTRQANLLQRRGRLAIDHPDSVAATFSLSFEKVQKANPAAADLLYLCAFLDPDGIQEEIFTGGASQLGPTLQPIATDPIKLNEAIGALLTYSLLSRSQNHSLTVHRLVQVVLKHSMKKNTQRRWAERVVRAVNLAFPEGKYENWLRCQQFIPHVLACRVLIDQWDMALPEAAQLLDTAGYYLTESAQYEQAELLLQLALAIRERVLGPTHPDTATSFNDLASLYRRQGKYELAEPLYQRALDIRERVLGPEHPDTAASLNSLALLYYNRGGYEQAEPLYLRAITIGEKTLGLEHPDLATWLNNLAQLYLNQSKYKQAELLYLRAFAIREHMLGPDHPDTATSINDLAALYDDQGKYDQAEPLYLRALAIYEKVLGPDHPWTATGLNNLAVLYKNQGKYDQAEPLFQRALAIRERVLGPEHPNTATSFITLAQLYQAQGKDEQAEKLFQRAQAIRERRQKP